MSVAVVPRMRCTRCRRPTSVCYCAAISTLPTATRIVILQHSRERDMPIGTARMATLCLPQSELHVGVRWAEHAALRAALADPDRPAILLYPGPGARDILTDPPKGPVTLVVVDGTWAQAKSVVRDNPILQRLPRYAFATPEPSHYRIRKEPRAEYCSTIEALMHVLGVLEGKPDAFRALLAPFHAMVDAQLAAQAARPSRRVRVQRHRKPIALRLPDALAHRFEDLVLVVGEANAWPYDRDVNGKAAPRDPQADELVHWVALRPSTGETFEQFAAPCGALSPSTAFHTRLAANRLVGERAALFDAFAAFVRPTDVIGAWGHYSTNLFTGSGGTLGERVDLRSVAQRLTNKKLGGIEQFAAQLGEPRAPLGDGRAGSRLAALAHIVEHVRRLASGGGPPPR
jgi:DTW domain-containing protein YfiP